MKAQIDARPWIGRYVDRLKADDEDPSPSAERARVVDRKLYRQILKLPR